MVCVLDKVSVRMIDNKEANYQNEASGDYIQDYLFELVLENEVIGKASLQLVDYKESFMGKTLLTEALKEDFIPEYGWGELSLYEWSYDALLSVDYENNAALKGERLAILHKLEVFPMYRGNGYAHELLTGILLEMLELEADAVLLKPHFFGEKLEEMERFFRQRMLMKFYQGYGFEEIPLPEDVKGTCYMILHLT